ncbi:E3 ubiquitin-protein ligase TRIM71-like [Babylonia areolata]|uniref:E3 ubiquitin-protein ligase TRIM71-like n=1 Tax=Babylonia areolata TaxID=304850 RepID=UPI003FD1C876
MASATKEEAEDLVVESAPRKCPACLESFLEPPCLIPCFHSLCRRCLTHRLQEKSGSQFPYCPVCLTEIVRAPPPPPPPRTATTITTPEVSAEEFPVDVSVEAALQVSQSGENHAARRRVCDVCEEEKEGNDVTWKCVQCEQFLCQGCGKIHSKLTSTRSHTLVTVNSSVEASPESGGARSWVRPTVLPPKERNCSLHPGETFRFFCNDCGTAICRDCKLTAHQPHSAEDLNSASLDMVRSLQAVSELCRNELRPRLKESLRLAREHKAGFEATASDILAQLRSRAEEVKRFVDQHVSEVEKQVSEGTLSLEAVLKSMSQTITSLDTMCTHVRLVQDTGRASDVTRLFSLVQRLFFLGVRQASAASSEHGGVRGSSFFQKPQNVGGLFGQVPGNIGGDIFGGVPGNIGGSSAPERNPSRDRFEAFVQEEWKRSLQVNTSAEATSVRRSPYQLHVKPEVPPFEAIVAQHIGTVHTVPSHALRPSPGFSFGVAAPKRVPKRGKSGGGLSQDLQTELGKIRNILSGRGRGGVVQVTVSTTSASSGLSFGSSSVFSGFGSGGVGSGFGSGGVGSGFGSGGVGSGLF